MFFLSGKAKSVSAEASTSVVLMPEIQAFLGNFHLLLQLVLLVCYEPKGLDGPIQDCALMKHSLHKQKVSMFNYYFIFISFRAIDELHSCIQNMICPKELKNEALSKIRTQLYALSNPCRKYHIFKMLRLFFSL